MSSDPHRPWLDYQHTFAPTLRRRPAYPYLSRYESPRGPSPRQPPHRTQRFLRRQARSPLAPAGAPYPAPPPSLPPLRLVTQGITAAAGPDPDHYSYSYLSPPQLPSGDIGAPADHDEDYPYYRPSPPPPPLRFADFQLLERSSGRLMPPRARSSPRYGDDRALFDEGHDMSAMNSFWGTPHTADPSADRASQEPTMLPSRASSSGSYRRESSRSDEGNRNAKRRRLDFDKTAAPLFEGFHYGRYGQVEPGALTLEIVSCDGGKYQQGNSYAAENILKPDESVYCTKGNRCNIVLQHQGCTTFSISELIIKAPDGNYSSPVREGLVFFSMTKDELQSIDMFRADDYPVTSAEDRQPTPAASEDMRLFLSARSTAERIVNAMDSDGRFNNSEAESELYSLLTIGYQEARARLDQESSSAPNTQTMNECSDDENDNDGTRTVLAGSGGGSRSGWAFAPAGWSPSPRSRSYRRRPAYSDHWTRDASTWAEVAAVGIATENEVDDEEDEDEDEDEDEYNESFVFPGGDQLSPRPRPYSDDDNDEESDSGQQRRRPARAGRDQGDRGGRNGRGSGLSSQAQNDGHPLHEEEAHDHGITMGHICNGGGECHRRIPFVKFKVEKSLNECVIVFDTPIAARYILLKMWNPHEGAGNIDIQGVVAKGFAGPRYFPAIELR